MNVTPNIVYINAMGYPIQSIYNGQDYDIDSDLLITNKEIVDACNRIEIKILNSEIATPVPYNGIKNTGENDKELTSKNMNDIDKSKKQFEDLNVPNELTLVRF
jgi:hypothetical protein